MGGRLLAPIAFAAALAWAAPPAQCQVGPREEIRDSDHGFRLARPGPAWTLLDALAARRINPEAVAGAVEAGSFSYGLVFVEQVGDMAPDDYLGLVVGNMGLENREVGEPRGRKLAGRDARFLDVRGTLQGLDLRYRVFVVPRPPFVYQLICWTAGPPRPSEEARYEEFVSSFHLLDGPVRPRQERQTTLEADGPGWRIRGGAFETAVGCLRVSPPEGWRLVVGQELRRMDAAAEVGLSRNFPDVYLTVHCLPVTGRKENAVMEGFLGEYADLRETPEGKKPLAMTVDGTAIPILRRLAPPGLPFRHWIAAFPRGETVIAVHAWAYESLRDEAELELAKALAGFRILGGKEGADLAAALAAAPDPQVAIDENACYRNGVFREFTVGLQWKRPAALWRVLLGQSARESNPDAVLAMRAPALGVEGFLEIVDPGGLGPAEFHRFVLDALLGDSGEAQSGGAGAGAAARGAPGPWRFADRDALRSRVEVPGGAESRGIEVITCVVGDRGLVAWFTGAVEAMKRAEPALTAALDGLRFAPKMKRSVREGGVHRDERLGFALTLPGDGSGVQDLGETMPVMKLGAALSWKERKGLASLIAIPFAEGVPDLDGFLQQIWRDVVVPMAARSLGKRADSLEGGGVTLTATVAGVPCRRQLVKGPTTLDAYFFVRGGVGFVLFTVGDEAGAEERGETVRGRFSLLE